MQDWLTYDVREELAARSNDGVEVTLLWDRETNALAVAVVDRKAGDSFELDVESGEALDVFNHPYAHAAHRGVTFEAALRQPVYA